MANEQAFEVKDFSGGIKDSHVGAPSNKGQAFTNLSIRPDLKTESRPGCTVYDTDYYQVPFTTSRKRVDSLYRFKDTDLFQTQNQIYHVNSGWVEITGPDGNSAFPTTSVEFDQNSYAEWNNHLIATNDRRQRPVFMYKDGSDFRLRTLGLPRPDSSVISFGAPGAESRLYALVWAHTYTIDGVQFTQRSAVSEFKPYTGTIPATINDLPVLTNTASDNYDTTNIVLEIYRSADGNQDMYKVGEVTNGTTVFNDATTDGDLDDGLVLYTDTGDLDYDQPPKCKFVVQLNGCPYFLNIEDSRGDIYPNRIVQGIADSIFAAPEGNNCDVDEALTGGAVAGQNVVVFTKNRTYRLEGTYDSTGQGGITKVEISRTSGCVSHKSIVQVLEGCYYAAMDGFYFTDGFKTIRISEDIPTTYKSIVQSESLAKRIYGAYDSFDKVVYWGASNAPSDDDNRIILAAHTSFGIKPDTPFTKFDGGYWAENFTASSLLYYDGKLIRGDENGIVLKHQDEELNDIKINLDTTPDEWTVLPVIYDYKSPAFDFGDVTRRKWVTRIVTYCDSVAKVAFSIFSNNDNTGFFRELAEVRSNSPVLWGDSNVLWGDSSVRWNFLPIISGNRRFPSPFRCSYKQIQITNSYTLIENSESMGNVTVDGSASTVTLNTVGVSWDVNAVDYFISFDTDDYQTEYKITARTSTVLTVENTAGTLPTGSDLGFKVRGYRKNEAIRLLSYSMIYQFLTPSQTPYRGES